jgi:hypothetical protein
MAHWWIKNGYLLKRHIIAPKYGTLVDKKMDIY